MKGPEAWWRASAWVALDAVGDLARAAFAEGCAALRNGTATAGLVEILNAQLPASGKALAASVDAGGGSEALLRGEVAAAARELSVAHAALLRLAEVAHVLFADQLDGQLDGQFGNGSDPASGASPADKQLLGGGGLAARAAAAVAGWPSFTLRHTRGLLEHHVCAGAPQVLLALPWLHHLCACPAFATVWRRAADSQGVLHSPQIAAAATDAFETTDAFEEAKLAAARAATATTDGLATAASGSWEAMYDAACRAELHSFEASAAEWAEAARVATSLVEREEALEAEGVAVGEVGALRRLFAMARHPAAVGVTSGKDRVGLGPLRGLAFVTRILEIFFP